MVDNLKSPVLRRRIGQAPVFNACYLDFSRNYGFDIAACNVGKGNEKYTVEGTTYVLGTTLLNDNDYPKAAFQDQYHAPCGIEELYKISKNRINVDDFHAHTERGVKQELFAHFVLLTLNRIQSIPILK